MAQEVEHVLGKDEVTSSNLVISSKKNVPYNEGRFFWSWGGISAKNISYNEGRFFGAGGHLRQKHSQQRGVLFLPLCFISLKNIPYNEGVFLELWGISVKSTPNKEECFFFRCVSFSSKNTSKNLDLNYLPSGFSQ